MKNIWFQAIGKVIDIFTNYEKKNKCVDYQKGDDYGNLDASGWDYQVTSIIQTKNKSILGTHRLKLFFSLKGLHRDGNANVYQRQEWYVWARTLEFHHFRWGVPQEIQRVPTRKYG